MLGPEPTDGELETWLLANSAISAAIGEARTNPERLRPRPERRDRRPPEVTR